ncbi:MAG: hypothetical protein IJW70_00265 [Clostridia bacterium]|nr:hypothetical protein [Clostridia bacterium]
MKPKLNDLKSIIFSADYSDYPIDSQANDARLFSQEWEKIQSNLNLPEFQVYRKFEKAQYLACQIAVEQRSYILITHLPDDNTLLISLHSPLFLFYQVQGLSDLSLCCSEIYARYDLTHKCVVLTFVCQD